MSPEVALLASGQHLISNCYETLVNEGLKVSKFPTHGTLGIWRQSHVKAVCHTVPPTSWANVISWVGCIECQLALPVLDEAPQVT